MTDDDAWPRRGRGPEPPISSADALNDARGSDAQALEQELDAVPVDRVVTNVDQTKIVTTKDRLQIILTEVTEDLDAGRDWKTPLGALIGLVVALVSSSWREISWIGLSADNVQGLVVAAFLAVLVWLIWAARKPRRAPDAKSLVLRTLERLEPAKTVGASRTSSPDDAPRKS